MPMHDELQVKHRLESRSTWQWKQDLHRMQLNAPRPIALVCDAVVDHVPPMYSTEFFGQKSSAEVAHLLVRNGNYLVRQREQITNYYVLSFKFSEKVLHFRLYYNTMTRMHYVSVDKSFLCLYDLVADGLLTYYMDMLTSMYLDTKPLKSTYMIVHKLKLEAMAIIQPGDNIVPPAHSDLRSLRSGTTDHHFKVTSLKGLNWCDFCANFMWGIIGLQQSLKCDACGYLAHHKCLDKIQLTDCSGCASDAVVDSKACFGVDLSQLAAAQGTTVPWLVTKCVDEIERRGGLQSEGLYRVSGFQEELDALKAEIDRDGTVADLSCKVYENINVITGILKLYFRLLPVPLITRDTYNALVLDDNVASVNTPIEVVNAIRDSLTILPEAHYYTLKYLAAHLFRVSCHHEYNKMGVHNLATVLCPSLMPLPPVTQGRVPDMSKGIEALALIISLHDTVFVH